MLPNGNSEAILKQQLEFAKAALDDSKERELRLQALNDSLLDAINAPEDSNIKV